MRFGLSAGQLGLLRSLLMYYAIPFRGRQLARFYAQFIQAGDLCFDIGAHVGNQLRVWSRLGARVVGVEPQPACMRFLKRCYRRHPSITLVEQAVGAVPRHPGPACEPTYPDGEQPVAGVDRHGPAHRVLCLGALGYQRQRVGHHA